SVGLDSEAVNGTTPGFGPGLEPSGPAEYSDRAIASSRACVLCALPGTRWLLACSHSCMEEHALTSLPTKQPPVAAFFSVLMTRCEFAGEDQHVTAGQPVEREFVGQFHA